jgi:anti-sigma factor RsiW
VTTDDLNCDEFVELVTAYIDNALDNHVRRRVEEHLATCTGCERYLKQIRRTVIELGRLPADQLSDRARDEMLAAFRGWHSGYR